MRTATPNLFILTAEIATHITGTGIDGDVLVNFAVANTEVNQRLFVPEAQLVVTGKFRLGKEVATIGIWISSILAIVSIPAPTEAPAEVESSVEPEIAPAEDVAPASSQTCAQKAAATRAANKAKAGAKTKAKSKTEAVPC